MVDVISVELVNIGVIENLKLDLEGQCLALFADSRKGKSTIQDAIRSSVGIIEYRQDALREGATEGHTDVILQDHVSNKRYSIKRKFSRGKLQRFDMKCLDTEKPLKWEDEIKQLFNGLDPKVYYFDHARFFFQEKSADARFEYAMKCVLGELYDKNDKDIKLLEDERGAFGKTAKELLARLRDSEITADNYTLLEEKYKEPKTLDEARVKRDEILEQRPNVQELISQLNDIKETNAQYILWEKDLAYLKNDRLPKYDRQLLETTELGNVVKSFLPENAVSLLDSMKQPDDDHSFAANMYKTLFSDIAKLGNDLAKINAHLSELNNELANITERIYYLETKLAEKVLDKELEIELSEKVDKVAEDIKELETKAQLVYDKYVQDAEIFNMSRYKYLQHKVDYDQLQILQEQWKEKDNAIKAIDASNIAAFKAYPILDQIEIRDIVKMNKDRNTGDMVETVHHHLYYNNRELKWLSVSMGESLEIAMLFQTVHNPRFKTVFFQDAQSLGSDFKSVAKAAEEKGFQWIAAFTKEDTPLTFKFKERTL